MDRRNRRLLLLSMGGVLAAAGGWLLRPGAISADPAATAQRRRDLAARYGVAIVPRRSRTEAAAPAWPAAAELEGSTITDVAAAAMPAALDGIAASLAVYPDGFFARHCPSILVCGGLLMDRRQAGGTYGPGWIMLVAPLERGRDSIVLTCRLGVHHEFSSIVYGKAFSVAPRWATLLPPGWKFADGNGAALDHADAPAPDPATGFLTAYGATTPENDFNVYAEAAFTEPGRLAGLAATHRLIARKTALLIDAYAGLDPRMIDVFRRLGLAAIVAALPELAPTDIPISPTSVPSARPAGPN